MRTHVKGGEGRALLYERIALPQGLFIMPQANAASQPPSLIVHRPQQRSLCDVEIGDQRVMVWSCCGLAVEQRKNIASH